MTNVHGKTDPHFARLREAFASCFADGHERGAAVAVMVDGKIVADLWGGHSDKAQTKPWAHDTLVNVWSSTKGIVAAAVAMVVERGQLDYGAPIAKVWPEFAANGKERISLDQAMSHTAGLNGVNTPITEADLCAWTPYVEALANMTPNWQPGTVCAYHALTYGHLAGEPLRRVTGKSVGEFIAQNIATPLGVDFFVGVPEQYDHRCAEMIEGNGAYDWITDVLKSPYPQAVRNPAPLATAPNHRHWRAAEIPGGNGHADARSLATIYGDLASGNSRLMRPETLVEATRTRFRGQDESFQLPAAFAAGFAVSDDNYANWASPKSFGHNGWGGTMAFGDPEAKLGFAFVTNYMQGFVGLDPRRTRLIEALYASL